MQRERGKVIGIGVHIFICLWTKNFELYSSDRLTISNIRGRTSRQIYRLALCNGLLFAHIFFKLNMFIACIAFMSKHEYLGSSKSTIPSLSAD